jgi:hypothetical protein
MEALVVAAVYANATSGDLRWALQMHSDRRKEGRERKRRERRRKREEGI